MGLLFKNETRPEPSKYGMQSMYFIQSIESSGPEGDVGSGEDVRLRFFDEWSEPVPEYGVTPPQWLRVDAAELKFTYGRDDDREVPGHGWENLPVDAPRNGWVPRRVRCDQTGGMTMVDVIEFWNEWCLTVSDECAVLHRSVADWLMA